MGGEWIEATIGDTLDLINGYAFKSTDFISHGVPVIKIKNVKAGEFSEHEFSYVSEDFLKNHSNKLACFGDLLISMSGNRHDGSPETWVGKVAQFRKTSNYFINQRVGALRVKKGVHMDSRFASYLLSSVPYQELFIAIATSSGGQANLSPAQILGAPMRYPPLPEQRAIAHILGTLDDKIELNRRRNQTLEAMARALFQDWFVDFGPVRAKCRGTACRAPTFAPYLPADLWQLFPDGLDEEGKPEGWEMKRISDYLSLAYGKSLPARKRHQGDVPVYGSGGITGFHNEALVSGPVVIVGRKGTVGSLYWEDRPCFPIDTVFYVQPEAPLPFCYYLLESLPIRDMNTDAAVPGLNRENVYRLEIAAPPDELISSFAEKGACFRDSIAALSREGETLAQLRDTLLPKLISGELRITDAEKFMERAA